MAEKHWHVFTDRTIPGPSSFSLERLLREMAETALAIECITGPNEIIIRPCTKDACSVPATSR